MNVRHELRQLFELATSSVHATTPAQRVPRNPARQSTRPSLELLEERDLMAAGYFDPTFGASGRAVANFADIIGPDAHASAGFFRC
jgi:hypothetical protein